MKGISNDGRILFKGLILANVQCFTGLEGDKHLKNIMKR